MLIELLSKGLLSKQKLLLENYKKIDINENQVMIISLIIHLSHETKKIITPLRLARFMTLSSDQIENELQDLLDKKLVKFKMKSIDFSQLFLRLVLMLENDKSKEANQYFIKSIEKDISLTLTDEQKEEVMQLLQNSISKLQVLDIVYKNEILNYQDLLKLMMKYSTKNNNISKFNWLDN